MKTEPALFHSPHMPRELAGVEKGLLETMLKLCAGELDWPLFIHGKAGRGKTAATLALLDHVGGFYFALSELCESVNLAKRIALSIFQQQSVRPMSSVEFWDAIQKAKMAALDEIGSRGEATEPHYESLKTFLDQRVGKPAIYCSNLSINELHKIYDDRIASRLAAGTVVELKGHDRRLKKKL